MTTAEAVGTRSVNPVARLLTALLIAGGLVLSVDWVSALTALVLELVLFFVVGARLRPVLTRGAVIAVAAALTAVTILLYGQPSGAVHWHFLLVTISDGSITLALATFLRVLAIALPSVILFADVDPTELADGLGQVLKLPARFVLGALAGLRLVGLLGQDWQYLGYAPGPGRRRPRAAAPHRRTVLRAVGLRGPTRDQTRHRDGGARVRRAPPPDLGSPLALRWT